MYWGKFCQLKQVWEPLHFTGVETEAQKGLDVAGSYGKLVAELRLVVDSLTKVLSTIWAPSPHPVLLFPLFQTLILISICSQLFLRPMNQLIPNSQKQPLCNQLSASILGFSLLCPTHSTAYSVQCWAEPHWSPRQRTNVCTFVCLSKYPPRFWPKWKH